MTFDGQELTIDKLYIDCPDKKTRVLLHLLEEFMKTKAKMIVGFSTDPQIPEDRFHLWAWEDDSFIHLGCLKETKDSFQHKYIQLIKHLNSQS